MAGYGTLGHLGVKRQGTLTDSGASGAVQDFVPLVSESIAATREVLKAEEIRGIIHEGTHYRGRESVAGNVVMEVHPVGIGYFMRSIFGQASATVAAGYSTTTFRPRQADFEPGCALPPYVLEVHRDMTSSFIYYGCVVNALELAYAAGTLTRATADIIGRTWGIVAKNTPSFPAVDAFPWNQASFSLGGVSSLSGILTDCTVRMTANVEAGYHHDLNRFPGIISRAGRWTCTVNGTVDYIAPAAHDLWDNWNTFSPSSLMIYSRATSGSLKLTVPRFRFTEFAPQIGGPNTITVAFAGEAEYDTAAGYLVEAVLVSQVASGYDLK